MSQIETAAILRLVDEYTAPAKAVTGVSGKLEKTLRDTQKQLSHLKTDRAEIATFTQLKKQSVDTKRALDKQQKEVNSLAKEYHQAKKPTAKLTREFNDAKKKSSQLKQQYGKQTIALEHLRRKLRQASIDTRKLSRHDKQLSREIDKTNKQLRTRAKLLGSMKVVSEHAKQSSAHLKKAGWYGAKLGAVVTGLGYVFKQSFVDSASEFERFRTILTTLNNGDVSKAKKEFDWINKFVATTPYQIAQVTEAFVKLRAYGIDPTTGSARILGDAASALGKDYLQGVEALADAMNGENERLKEAFNIKATVDGEKIVYRYTDIKTGMEATASAARNSKKDIEKTLLGILNKNYAGAMADQVKTWGGMVSLVGDQWTRFVNMVMDHGLFDWMKSELGGIIAELDKMAANGQLEAFAKEFADNLKQFMQEGWQVLKALFAVLKEIASALKWAADALGGWNNLAWLLIALPLAGSFLGIALSVFGLVKTLKELNMIGGAATGKMHWLKRVGLALGQGFMWLGKTALPLVGKAILWVGRALMANPIGLIITAIGLAAYFIIKHWSRIKPIFNALWDGIKGGALMLWDFIVNYSPFGLLIKGVKKLKNLIKGFWGDKENKVAVEATKHIKQLPANDPYYRSSVSSIGRKKADAKSASTRNQYSPLRSASSVTKEVHHSAPATIKVYAAEGMNVEELAKLVDKKIAERERQSERRRRGRLHG